MIEEILTGVTYKNTHMSKVGGRKRKKVQYLINTQITQNKTTGGVKLQTSVNPRSKYHMQSQQTPGSNCGVKDRDKVRQEGDWKITPKNKYDKISTIYGNK
jgi:hypothetical protein